MSSIRVDIQDCTSNASGLLTILNHSIVGLLTDPPKDTSAAILGVSLMTDQIMALHNQIISLSNKIN
jgi:hypothetical protein